MNLPVIVKLSNGDYVNLSKVIDARLVPSTEKKLEGDRLPERLLLHTDAIVDSYIDVRGFDISKVLLALDTLAKACETSTGQRTE